MIHHAVEVNTSQAKRLGCKSNLYIVQGQPICYVASGKDYPDAIKCEITTRAGSSRNRIGYLAPEPQLPAAGLDPRPNHQWQWTKNAANEWVRL